MAPLQKDPFTPQRLEEERAQDKRKTLPVSLNLEEQEILSACQHLLHQPKESTALKQLAFFGAKVLQRQETLELLDMVFNNDRKNARLGIHDYE